MRNIWFVVLHSKKDLKTTGRQIRFDFTVHVSLHWLLESYQGSVYSSGISHSFI